MADSTDKPRIPTLSTAETVSVLVFAPEIFREELSGAEYPAEQRGAGRTPIAQAEEKPEIRFRFPSSQRRLLEAARAEAAESVLGFG